MPKGRDVKGTVSVPGRDIKGTVSVPKGRDVKGTVSVPGRDVKETVSVPGRDVKGTVSVLQVQYSRWALTVNANFKLADKELLPLGQSWFRVYSIKHVNFANIFWQKKILSRNNFAFSTQMQLLG